jgi:nucleotide-binding universal stress UspA family protein
MIVCAYNGSEDSQQALRWAAAESVRRGCPLRVVTVVPPTTFVAMPYPESLNDDVTDEATAIAGEGADLARGYGAHEVSAVGVMGQPSAVLIEQSRTADLIVMGSRGHGPVVSALIGSVAYAVTAHAPCPVTVVRGDQVDLNQDGPVVVGFDGSAAASRSVDYAADVAAGSGRELHIVSVWFDDSATLAAVTVIADFRTEMQQEATRTLHAESERIRVQYPGLVVADILREGRPAHELSDQARAASLLVTGTRGHGGFTGLMLGSVTHDLLAATPCPLTTTR